MKVKYDKEVDAAYIQLSSKSLKAVLKWQKGLSCIRPLRTRLSA